MSDEGVTVRNLIGRRVSVTWEDVARFTAEPSAEGAQQHIIIVTNDDRRVPACVMRITNRRTEQLINRLELARPASSPNHDGGRSPTQQSDTTMSHERTLRPVRRVR